MWWCSTWAGPGRTVRAVRLEDLGPGVLNVERVRREAERMGGNAALQLPESNLEIRSTQGLPGTNASPHDWRTWSITR